MHVTRMSHVLPAALEAAGAHILASVGTVSVGSGRDVLAVKEEVRGQVGGGGHEGAEAPRGHIGEAGQVQVVEVGQAGGTR